MIGSLWTGLAIDINIHFPFTTGAIIMLIGFFASMVYLRRETASKAEPAMEASDSLYIYRGEILCHLLDQLDPWPAPGSGRVLGANNC